MASKDQPSIIIKMLCDAVFSMDEESAVTLSEEVIKKKVDIYKAVTEGLAAGMKRAGALYDKGEYYVPELLLCSDALYAGLEILLPHIKIDSSTVSGKIILGVVEGDIHDIGKNLVKAMLIASGWEVYDLGKDVKLERFVEEQQKRNADMVGLSALMTTSMLAMQKVIKMLKTNDPDVIVVVGGAPLTQEIADQYGADGYANNAKNAVEVARKLLKKNIKASSLHDI